MCGIVGVVQYKSALPREVRHRALRILFSETMLKTESRGRDATGLYQVHEDGDWMMTKKGQKVTDWLFLERSGKVEDPIIYSEIMDTWIEHPKELKTVVGHCRAATVGSKGRDNNDNHPFAVQLDEQHAILGIHNGTLTNHEIIFKKLPDVLPRQGSVDSEAIFHFLYHLTEAGTKPVDADMLKYLGQRLDGAYAVIMVNSRFPNQVVTFKKERPMEYFMISPLNIVIIASDKRFVESALEKYDFIRQMGLDKELPSLQFLNRSLLERDYRIFDASKEWVTGSLIHSDLDKISAGGIMTTANEKILPEWATTTKSVTTYAYSEKGTGVNSGAAAPSAATAVAAPAAEASVKVTKKSEGSESIDQESTGADEAGVVVEVAIGSEEEAERARERSKALGAMVEYDTSSEVAKSLGLEEKDLDQMPGVDLANKLAHFHFSLGYGAARLQNKRENEEIYKKAQNQTARMEYLLDKQKKAQSRIWEHRQVVTILLALHSGGFKLNSKNVSRALAAFPDLEPKRRKDIQDTATPLLESKEIRDLVTKLVRCFKEADPTVKKPSEVS